MPTPLQLEVFESDAPQAVAQTLEMRRDAFETACAEAYEAGREAGRAEAEAACETAAAERSATLEANLQSLSFSYHEARAHVLSGLAPLFRLMTDKVLPEAAHATLGQSLVEAVEAHAGSCADAPLTLAVAPEVRESAEATLARFAAPPVGVIADDALEPGEARLHLGARESRIDLDGVLQAMRGIIDDHLATEAFPTGTRPGADATEDRKSDHG